jgi:hypothetical protein
MEKFKRIEGHVDKWGEFHQDKEFDSDEPDLIINFDEYFRWFYVMKIVNFFKKIFCMK